jgi:hypothetical protein
MRKNVSGQRLFFNLVAIQSGLPTASVTIGNISGRRAVDDAAQAVIAGSIAEVGGGQYRADLFAADTNGNCIGYLFTASGMAPVSFSVFTIDGANSGGYIPPSGTLVNVYSGQLSGQSVAVHSGQLSGAFVSVHSGQLSGQRVSLHSGQLSGFATFVLSGQLSGQLVTAASGVFGTASLNSGMSVLVYSGQMSGQQVNLHSGNQTQVWSGTFVNVFSGRVFPASGQIAFPVWNELLTGATYNVANTAGRRLRTLQDVGNYAFGAVWIDTNSANAGSTFPDDGTFLNPVQSLANALTVAAAATQAIKKFHLLNGSSITLAQGFSNYVFGGEAWTLALGGQDVSNSVFSNATVSGTATGTDPEFDQCFMGACTLPPCRVYQCALTDTVTVGSAGDFTFDRCWDQVAGAGAPVLDFGGAVGGTSVSLRKYSGAIEVRNLKAGDELTIDGMGRVVLDSSCTGGSVIISGNMRLTDNSGGAVTVTDGARFASGNVYLASGHQALLYSGAVGVNQITSGALHNVAARVHQIDMSGLQNGMLGKHTAGNMVLKQTSRFVVSGAARTFQTDGTTVQMSQAIVDGSGITPTRGLGVAT